MVLLSISNIKHYIITREARFSLGRNRKTQENHAFDQYEKTRAPMVSLGMKHVVSLGIFPEARTSGSLPREEAGGKTEEDRNCWFLGAPHSGLAVLGKESFVV